MTSALLSAITTEMQSRGWSPAPLDLGGTEYREDAIRALAAGCEAASYTNPAGGHTITLILDPLFVRIAGQMTVGRLVTAIIDCQMGEPESDSIN